MQGGSMASWRAASELLDYEPDQTDYRTIRTAQPVARKAHRCTLCGNAINAGYRHELDVFTVDGVFTVERRHLHGACTTAAFWDHDGGPPEPRDEAPFYCVAGCGYEVAYANSLCAECGCEDDGDLY